MWNQPCLLQRYSIIVMECLMYVAWAPCDFIKIKKYEALNSKDCKRQTIWACLWRVYSSRSWYYKIVALQSNWTIKNYLKDVFLLNSVTVPTPDGEITLVIKYTSWTNSPDQLQWPKNPCLGSCVRDCSVHLKRNNCWIIFKGCGPLLFIPADLSVQLSAPRSKAAPFDTQCCSEVCSSSISVIQVWK